MTSKETTLAAILVGLIIVCGSVCFVVSVNHDRAIHLKRIDAAIEWKQQDQETERTEERSQFWQKAVPWGKDEAEDPHPDSLRGRSTSWGQGLAVDPLEVDGPE